MGLGNPGPKYVGARHNIGFEVVSRLSGSTQWESRQSFDHTCVTIRSRPVLLIKPTTYMNDSGLAVEDALSWSGGTLRDVLILVDDIHLAVGRARVRRSGSEGGHNGLRSIGWVLKSDDFPRVRLGVGEVPSGISQIDYVLGAFDTTELPEVERMVDRAAEAVRAWCGSGVEAAMNTTNGR